MRGRSIRIIAAVCLAVAGAFAADVANLGGTWTLDTQKSKWGNKDPVPHEGKITVEHSEPKLKYSGSVEGEAGPRNTFEFDGAIDGKEYPIANGTIRFRRLGSNSIESVMKSQDGTYQETATTSISADGKTLTRRIQAKGPHGTTAWTEVYNKLH